MLNLLYLQSSGIPWSAASPRKIRMPSGPWRSTPNKPRTRSWRPNSTSLKNTGSAFLNWRSAWTGALKLTSTKQVCKNLICFHFSTGHIQRFIYFKCWSFLTRLIKRFLPMFAVLLQTSYWEPSTRLKVWSSTLWWSPMTLPRFPLQSTTYTLVLTSHSVCFFLHILFHRLSATLYRRNCICFRQLIISCSSLFIP